MCIRDRACIPQADWSLMLEEHYPFVAQPLPYEYDALLPVLDEETLHFHHDKHYQTYVDKLNATLADYPQLQQMRCV